MSVLCLYQTCALLAAPSVRQLVYHRRGVESFAQAKRKLQIEGRGDGQAFIERVNGLQTIDAATHFHRLRGNASIGSRENKL